MATEYKPITAFEDPIINCGSGVGCESTQPSPHKTTPQNKLTAQYLNPQDMLDMRINGNPLNNGLYEFPRDYEQEIADWVTGGNSDFDKPRLAATDVGQILFMPPTQESMNFDFSNTPWVDIDGLRRVIPLDIRTVLMNTPLNYPLFKPTRVNANGFLSFRYIGEEPIHGIIEGSFSVMVRLHPTVDTGYNRLILSLDPVGDVDFVDVGQGRGRRFLAVSPGNWDQRFAVHGTEGLTNTTLDITSSFMTPLTSMSNKYISSLPGYFRATTPTDELEHFNTGSTVPLGPEVRSTSWFDVTQMDLETEALVFWCKTGQSTRGRIRVRDAEGVITYLADQSTDRSAIKLFNLPVGSVEAQIYYSGPGNSRVPEETPANIEIKRVPANNQASISTIRGYWVHKQFHVKRDITLNPGTEYCLNFLSNVYEGATNISYGFRYEGGGLSLTFDAGWLRKKMAKNLFGDV